jgi:hypothetical protein
MMSIIPSQKCGIATPEMAKEVTAMSASELRLTAEMVPSEIPRITPKIHAAKPSCTVNCKRSMICGKTLIPVR